MTDPGEAGVGDAGAGDAGAGRTAAGPSGDHLDPRRRRPLLERLGMAVIAVALALLFGAIAAASWAGGEGFLAVMAGTGAVMTLWAGVMTLLRG